MRHDKGSKGFMAIKIDLEKAYEKLDWNLIIGSLEEVGLNDYFVNPVWHCMSSTSMNILWNGEATSQFFPTRGIRQRDPISPYLFVICLERLSHLI